MCMNYNTICYLALPLELANQIHLKEKYAHSIALVPANASILKQRIKNDKNNTEFNLELQELQNINDCDWIEVKLNDTTNDSENKFSLNTTGFLNSIQSFYQDITFYTSPPIKRNTIYWEYISLDELN